jgi:hypothetical protein
MKATITALVTYEKNESTMYFLEFSVNKTMQRIQINELDLENIKSANTRPGWIEESRTMDSGGKFIVLKPKTAKK